MTSFQMVRIEMLLSSGSLPTCVVERIQSSKVVIGCPLPMVQAARLLLVQFLHSRHLRDVGFMKHIACSFIRAATGSYDWSA